MFALLSYRWYRAPCRQRKAEEIERRNTQLHRELAEEGALRARIAALEAELRHSSPRVRSTNKSLDRSAGRRRGALRGVQPGRL